MERRWIYEQYDGKHGIFEGSLLIAVVGECFARSESARDVAQEVVRVWNEHDTLVEQRDRLARMLANVIDANYGTSIHHIGDGDGMPEEQAKEIQEWWQAYLRQIQDDYNRENPRNALATVEQGDGRESRST